VGKVETETLASPGSQVARSEQRRVLADLAAKAAVAVAVVAVREDPR
jgi:hypothetical protein